MVDPAQQTPSQIAGMGLMGFGGLVSIIGGIMFLVLMYLAMKPGRKLTREP